MKLLWMIAVLGVMLMGATVVANAQETPNVRGIAPYSAQANYLSLPGYMRWRTFQETGRWISWSEAVARVNSQLTVAAAPST